MPFPRDLSPLRVCHSPALSVATDHSSKSRACPLGDPQSWRCSSHACSTCVTPYLGTSSAWADASLQLFRGRDGWQSSAPLPSLEPLTSWAAATLAYAVPSLAALLIPKHPGGDTVSSQPTCPLMETGGQSREHESQQERQASHGGQTFFIFIRMFLTHLLEKRPEGWWADGWPGSENPGRTEGRQLCFSGWAIVFPVTDETGGKSGRGRWGRAQPHWTLDCTDHPPGGGARREGGSSCIGGQPTGYWKTVVLLMGSALERRKVED